MIEELLPHYYEVYEHDLRYRMLRSVVIDGHEVAWMRYTGTVAVGERAGDEFSGNAVYCECDFTEGVGWEYRDGTRFSRDGPQKCLPRRAALFLRQLELAREFNQAHPRTGMRAIVGMPVDELILWLLAKGKRGEFLGEDTGGAQFWGGYFYLQLVGKIANVPMSMVWDAANKLEAEEKISLEGAVVQDYRAPRPEGEDGLGNFMPVGEPVVEGGFYLRAWQPANSDAPREIIVRVWPHDDPEGEPLREVRVPMMHENMFGLDVEDGEALERATDDLLTELAQPQQSAGGTLPGDPDEPF